MKRYYPAGILVLAAIIIAWHYYAANRAETMIDQAIREQVSGPETSYSIDYSPISISPFSGDIHFNNLSVIGDSSLFQSNSLHINLRYGDFLNFYIWGTETGLRNIQNSSLQWTGLSYLNRKTLDEYKADSLYITYRGDAWEILRHLFANLSVTTEQSVSLTGRSVTVSRPQTFLGTLKIQNAEAEAFFPGGTDNLWTRGRYEAAFDSIDWTPPESFQEKYRFFIRGFGYAADAIPLRSSVLQARPDMSQPGRALTINNTQILTDLATLSIEGRLVPGNTFMSTTLDSLNMTLTNLSDSFKNVLANVEQMMNRRISTADDELHFLLTGTLREPTLRLR